MNHDGQRPYINWTHKKVQDLRIAYKRAEQEHKKEFVFEGHILLTSYAKYLLEYLEGHFGKE